MWEELWPTGISFLNLFFRAVFAYLYILLLLRISGKRELGQLEASEFVTILLISEAAQNSMTGGDESFLGGMWVVLILVAMSSLISFLVYRSEFFKIVFEGVPRLVVHRGQLVRKNMRKERMSESELRALLRKQGVRSLSEVHSAILEADGSLSVINVEDLRKK